MNPSNNDYWVAMEFLALTVSLLIALPSTSPPPGISCRHDDALLAVRAR